jgi:ClpP class serine protease
VTVIRKHYKTVNFVVPDYAMSAGTIFCMSGDKIFMDYASALGRSIPRSFQIADYPPDRPGELV